MKRRAGWMFDGKTYRLLNAINGKKSREKSNNE